MILLTKCIRCGKLRILGKTWSDKIGNATTTHTNSVCPDSACQVLVDEQLKTQHDELETRIRQSSERRKENIAKNMLARKMKKLEKPEKRVGLRYG